METFASLLVILFFIVAFGITFYDWLDAQAKRPREPKPVKKPKLQEEPLIIPHHGPYR